MPRPRKPRFVNGPPIVDRFHPHPFHSRGRGEVLLPLEGLEAVRLSDYEGLSQEAAAERMNVSRQTFGRILMEARKTIAESLVLGKVLRIEGGHFELTSRCRRRRRGRNGSF
jgi:predicted DNA-binding protein (UPF0251 family)